ncbi:hypothetical protein B0H13DRAFT_2677016 [Mycena leptocephala]|nr:hypothetical protein B0H13DRAFT_2677016 [Mycena leptocephala]
MSKGCPLTMDTRHRCWTGAVQHNLRGVGMTDGRRCHVQRKIPSTSRRAIHLLRDRRPSRLRRRIGHQKHSGRRYLGGEETHLLCGWTGSVHLSLRILPVNGILVIF